AILFVHYTVSRYMCDCALHAFSTRRTSYLGLHDPVVYPEHFNADFDFFLGRAERVDHLTDGLVKLFRRRGAFRTEGGQNLYPVRSESTRLNSIHFSISYAFFCLKK